MITDFDPEKYADERRKKILDLLKKKTKEKAPVEAPEIEEAGEGPADLVAALSGEHAQNEKEPVNRKIVEIAGRGLLKK